ncbi:10 kDa chaperonin [Zea mays]|uniref:10 kDa chaperonin n=1 Tax=Zea mays TaxID=4577 RepID=A0A1D6I1A6_MAIZE|nr:10 kDa chaperonin [Zea mays]
MAKRLLPSLNRVLVEKLVQPKKTADGILLSETSKQLNAAKVVAVGPGERDKGRQSDPSCSEGRRHCSSAQIWWI